VLVVPVLGGLLYGPARSPLRPEARGHGVPEVMLAVAESGGRIRPPVTIVKALASAITIGTGGALWRGRPEWARPVVGGLALGLLLLALPQMYGVGYPVMDSVIAGHVVSGLVLVFLVGKIAATSLTLSIGGSGGVFAPTKLLRRGIDIERPRRNETLARATGR
jgi:H+/Cl- antiporter ClcA